MIQYFQSYGICSFIQNMTLNIFHHWSEQTYLNFILQFLTHKKNNVQIHKFLNQSKFDAC